MKMAFFDLEGWEAPIINEKVKNSKIEVIRTDTALLDPTKLGEIKGTEILSVSFSKADRDVINALPGLKLISTRTTGFDQIDIGFAKEKNIAVINVPAYGAQTVAEYAFALILTLSRKLKMTFLRSMFGVFDQKEVRGNDLEGKTLGVLGTGKIGQKLVKMAFGFDMKIICYDLYPNKEITERYGAKYVPLEELLRTADVISIHSPYTKETHHLIDADAVSLMKKGVLLVNTARGPIVDISAVFDGIKRGVFGGVAFDTFEGEQIWIKAENILQRADLPSPESFKSALESFYLQRFREVVLTPHNAFNSHEAVRRILDTALADSIAFSEKGDCEHRLA
ncbi:MAG: NAD(P)-dependent oxidoreductase [Candidatus Omnitrophota bacterium]